MTYPILPLVILGYRRSFDVAVLDAWLRAYFNPPRGVA